VQVRAQLKLQSISPYATSFHLHSTPFTGNLLLIWVSVLTDNAVGVLLLEGGEGGDDEAEGGHHHKQTGHHRHHLHIGTHCYFMSDKQEDMKSNFEESNKPWLFQERACFMLFCGELSKIYIFGQEWDSPWLQGKFWSFKEGFRTCDWATTVVKI
jgi:hypothetical protein